MPIHDIYSKRAKRQREQTPDVFTYDKLPDSLRHQIAVIIREFFVDGYDYENTESYVMKILKREYGRPSLAIDELWGTDDFGKFISKAPIEEVLDGLELMVVGAAGLKAQGGNEVSEQYGDLIIELNQRFFEAGVGFQIENLRVCRVDSKMLHQEAVKPALVILSAPRFAAAAEEFLRAYDHYRHGHAEEALLEACKSFESVMKVICDGHRWSYDPGKATAKNLINTLLTNGLLPTWMQEHFSGLRSVLESGVPTPRNKFAGHGDGAEEVKVPSHFVSYVLHLTASNIVMLAEADEDFRMLAA